MKKITIILISFCIIFMLSGSAFAISDILGTGENWETIGKDHATIGIDSGNLKELSNDLYFIFLNVAIAVAVIAGAILGIQYMTAGISKKAQVKESLFPYMISCIVVFGAFGIWRLVVYIMAKV